MLIQGTYNGVRNKDFASRRRIMVCEPVLESEEISCASEILSRLARQAYRRPVNQTDVEALLSAYQKGRNQGNFENGIQRALQLILADPEFLYREEAAPESVHSGEVYRISDLELASRLSFFSLEPASGCRVD